MVIKYTTIEEYISMFPENIQIILKKIRKIIKKNAPNSEETINYQIPTFRLNGNLVHFAAFKNHIGFYPTSTGIKYFEKDLIPYKHAKGSVQFRLDEPIPFGLIAKIVKFRVKENLNK
jgi:uncharacterized protein YdhG (YjbR/CyaY superfamily)